MTIQPTHYDDQAQHTLAHAVEREVRHGWTVRSASPHQVTLSKGGHVSHLLHLILTLLTVGLWLPVWVVVSCTGRARQVVLTVDQDGNVVRRLGSGHGVRSLLPGRVVR